MALFWVAMHGPDRAFASAIDGYQGSLRRDVGPHVELRQVDGDEMQRLMRNYMEWRVALPKSVWNWSA